MSRAQKLVHQFKKDAGVQFAAAGFTGAAEVGLDRLAVGGDRASEAANLLRRNLGNLTNPVGWVALTADIISTGLALSDAEEKSKAAERSAENNRQAMMAMANSYDEARKKAEAYQAAVEQQARINAVGGAGGSGEQQGLAFAIDTSNLEGADLAVAQYWQRVHEFYATHQEDLAKMSEMDKQVAEAAQTAEAENIRRLYEKNEALKNTMAIEEQLANLKREADNFGKTEAQLKLEALRAMKGITSEQIAQGEQAIADLEAKKEAEAAAKYTAENAERAAREAAKQPEAEKQERGITSNPALTFGSAAAFSASIAGRNPLLDEMKMNNKLTAQQLVEMRGQTKAAGRRFRLARI